MYMPRQFSLAAISKPRVTASFKLFSADSELLALSIIEMILVNL